MKGILSRAALATFALFALGTLYSAALPVAEAPADPIAAAECPTTGWAFGVYLKAEDAVRYVAHGPITAWTTDGTVTLVPHDDGPTSRFTLDFSRVESGVLIVTLRVLEEPEGYEPSWRMVEQSALYLNPLVCAFYGVADSEGDALFFGVLTGLEDHAHTDVRLVLPDNGMKSS